MTDALGALTYAELGAMHPQAGGLYSYIRDAFGRFPAFLFGWSLFFVISSGSIATLAVAGASYLGQLVPLDAFSTKLAAVTIIAMTAFINSGAHARAPGFRIRPHCSRSLGSW